MNNLFEQLKEHLKMHLGFNYQFVICISQKKNNANLMVLIYTLYRTENYPLEIKLHICLII